MKNRLTHRAAEFCRLYVQGMSAPKAALHAGYARSTAQTAISRLTRNPLVEARILRLRGEKLIRRSDLEYMRERTLLLIEGTTDGKLLLSTMRFLAKLDSHITHPLDDPQRLAQAEQRAARKSKPKTIPAAHAPQDAPTRQPTQIQPNNKAQTTPSNPHPTKPKPRFTLPRKPKPSILHLSRTFQRINTPAQAPYKPISHWGKSLQPIAPHSQIPNN